MDVDSSELPDNSSVSVHHVNTITDGGNMEPMETVIRKKRKRKMQVDEQMPADDQSEQLLSENFDTQAKINADEVRRIIIPRHRYSALRKNWTKIVSPIVNQLKLQIRYNLRTHNVEIRCPPGQGNKTDLQKAADFINAYILGFDIDDAIALIRLDHLFLETFEINDVKTLRGDNLSRAIGRIAGKDGRTKQTIENVTKTRIVLANDKIHLLGAYQNLRVARHTICSLILGTPPNKVYGNLRNLSSRLAERL